MVDRLVDIEQEDICVVTLEDVGLGEVNNASAVDEEEELDLVIHAWLFDFGKELSVSGNWIHLVLDIFALEKFLSSQGGTESILSEQSESTSMAEKTTIETYEIFICSCIFSKSRMMSFKSILIWRY